MTPIAQKTDLRIRAEAELRERPRANKDLSESDMKRLVHELQVHQIQLEMQNDELRKSQLELQDAHDKFHDLYNFAPMGYISINKEGIIIEANIFAATMFGTVRDNLIGKKFNQFIDPNSQDTFYLHHNAIIESPTVTRNCEINLKRINDLSSIFSVQISCMVLKLNGDYQIKMAITDISEIKRLQKEKEDAIKLLEKQKRHIEIGEMAGKIAHDFNNVLAIIMGNAEVLMFDCHDPNIVNSLKIILEQTDRGRCLTKELQKFSKDSYIKDCCVKTDVQQCYTNKNILIVEDEKHIVTIQKMVLTSDKFNHTVDVAQDGKTAIELFENNKYDFISLDYILLGGLNGMDVYKHIRKINPFVPVLFISGNIEFLESIKQLKQQDPNTDHLSKPHGITEYVNCIHQLMTKSEAYK